MSTAFKNLTIGPGVVATPTTAMNSTAWAEVNLVRWREKRLMPVGGQLRYNFGVAGGGNSFASRCKRIHGWYGIDGIFRVAYLCETNLYVDVGGIGGSILLDITPTGGMAPLPVIATGGYGDGLYGQGLQIKAAAAFTTSSSTITMAPGSVGPVAGVNVFNVTTNLNVGTVQTYSGTTLTLTAPALSASQGANDLLNFGAYNETRGTTSPEVLITSVPNAFSLDNFGSILYAMTSPDGRLLMWDPNVGGKAVVQPPSGARGPVPTGRCFVVTPERFIIIFGSRTDGTAAPDVLGRRFAWCDQENPGAWDYSSITSQAGYLDIEPASPILCAMATRVGILFWSGKKVYVSRFLGMPYIYNYTELGDATTPWSPQSVVTTSSMTVWMSEQGAFSFDGTSILPVACPVRPWIDEDINALTVREQACAVHVEPFNEFWWFFPSDADDNPSGYNDKAIIYNYTAGWWSQALMARSAGVTSAYNSHTIMANGQIAYEHESVSSAQYSPDATLPFAETFDLNVYGGGGSRLVTVKQLIPDIAPGDPDDDTGWGANPPYGPVANIQYRLFYRNSRSVGALEQSTPPAQIRPDGYVDFRTTGRDIRLRFEVISNQVLDFTLGNHLIDVVPRGDR